MAKDNLYNVVKSFADEFDILYAQILGMKTAVYLSTAVGDELDLIGNIFGLPRKNGETDDAFRNRIQAYFQSFIGGGVEQSLKQTIATNLGIDESDVTIISIGNGKFRVKVALTDSEEKTLVQDTVADTKAAGTYAYFEFETTEIDETIYCTDIALVTPTNIAVYDTTTYDSTDTRI